MKLTGAQLILKLLERQGITCISGIPGGANLPLYDALHASPIRHVLARHEQGAGHRKARRLLRHLRAGCDQPPDRRRRCPA